MLEEHLEASQVSIEEFLEGCSKLKGHARSIDVHALMRQCRALHRELHFVATNLGVDMQSTAAMAIRPRFSAFLKLIRDVFGPFLA